mmetsp:Transcript_6206/g.16304  ORF Transcript_6206/g.16304 Transcript_6206/m.16304 type:complete len:321 (+) Transcript_6206:176-1138(+)
MGSKCSLPAGNKEEEESAALAMFKTEGPVQVDYASDDRALCTLKYASDLVVDLAREAELTIAGIMAGSLRNNPAREITGMLYYDRHTKRIVQVLEGPMCNVGELFNKIARDTRHVGCRLLEQRLITERAFPNFGMALARAVDPESDQATGAVPAAEHLIRLQYTSTLLAPSAEEGRALLQGILEASVRNNSDRKIGGLLVFNPHSMQVVQLLEGPAPAVRELFTTIMVDTRHKDCRLTSEELLLSSDEYLFGSNWGLLQGDTHHSDLLGLSTRIRDKYHATAAKAAVQQSDKAQMEVVLGGMLAGPSSAWDMTPISSHVM